MKRLVLIDGKSVFYRGYYAMGALALADGTPTGGVYGFAAIAMEIVRDLAPDKVVVAWDSKSSTAKRRAIYGDYKAGRKKPDEDFYAQIPLLKELVLALGWEFVEIPEYEADDIIGTLSAQADAAGDWETIIVSSDLDMLQIVDENTRMYRILKGFSKLEEMDVAAVEEKYGIRKEQFLDLKALKGDASDNIPGVAGIGEKTAVKMLNEFGSLEGVYEALERGEIKGATAKKFVAGKESALMSRRLGEIMMDAPVELGEIPELVWDEKRVVGALMRLEFKSLVRKFGMKPTEAPVSSNKLDEGAGCNWLEVDGVIVSWDVKELMHENSEVAERILAGERFWDLGQGRFLLNPLGRGVDKGGEVAEYGAEQMEFEDYPALYKIFVQFDLPLIPVLYKMEKYGMLIDREYFGRLKAEFEEEVGNLEREVWDYAGERFNVNSPAQLSEVLFGKLGLPTQGIKKGARGYSTGAKELDKLEDKHEIIGAVKRYREAAKLLSTYIAPLPELADKQGRIHTTFNQNVTATGRLSSTNPNLQNIPVRTEVGKRIRTGFVAPEGRVLVSADYSQFELRLAAALAGDEEMIEVFNRGEDVHTKTAAEAFGIPVERVTKDQRRAAKVINFGVLYGMSARGLAEAADMSLAEAKEFIEKYFASRVAIKEYLEGVLRDAREKGYVQTLYGRRRPTPDVLSSNFMVRAGAERAAQNMPIQGTEADLMKKAMIGVEKGLMLKFGARSAEDLSISGLASAENLSMSGLVSAENSDVKKSAEAKAREPRLAMQVHDSLMVECDEGDVEEVREILRQEMENVAPEIGVKLKVDIHVGRNWGEL